MKVRAAAVVLGLGPLCALAGACLPQPAPRATIDVTVRGGAKAVTTNDGYVLRLDRRLVVVSIGTSSTTQSLSTGTSWLRNLDASPYDMPAIRARGERFVVVATNSYYQGTPTGPGVEPGDVDLVDGEPVGNASNGYGRSGVSSFALTGSLSKGDRTWTFSWHGSIFDDVICARLGAEGITPIVFESEAHYALDVVVNLEHVLGSGSASVFGQPLVDADENGDGRIDEDELVRGKLSGSSRPIEEMFTVSLDGEALYCRGASSGGRPPY